MPKASSTCHCCPYGFHIDRDFVQYCESLYNNAQLNKLKIKKRERRKEQITVESCLGLNTLKLANDSNGIPMPQIASIMRSPSEGSVLCYLDGVMSDFEETWQKSITKSTSGYSSDIMDGAKEELNLHSHTQEKMSNADPADIHISPSTVGIQRDVLTTIREQMATSLKRMKELENQVKCIPDLKVKISALNEERNQLLNQLKSKSSVSDTNEGSIKLLQEKCVQKAKHALCEFSSGSLTSSTEDLTSPAMAHNLNDALAKRSYVDSEIVSLIKFDENSSYLKNLLETKTKEVKHVGTLCSVLTRDIGVGHIQNRCKSTGVGDINVHDIYKCLHCLQEKRTKLSASMSSESFESDSDSVYNEFRIPLSSPGSLHGFARKSVKTVSTSPIDDALLVSSDSPNNSFTHKKLEVHHTGISTDLLMSDVIDSSTFETHKIVKKNKSTSCEIPLKSSKYVQVPGFRFLKGDKYSAEIGTQTITPHTVHDVEKKVNRRSIGTGDCTIDYIYCDKCASRRHKNASVGDYYIHEVICDKCCHRRMVSVGCGDLSIFDVSCKKCELRQTETVGVGDSDVNQPFLPSTNTQDVDKMQNSKEQPVMMRSIGLNTTALMSANSVSNTIHICDKCNAAIHSVAQDFTDRKKQIPHAAKTTDLKTTTVNTSKPSRIPSSIKSQISSKAPGEKAEDNDEKSVFISPSVSTVVELSKEVKAACKVLCDCLQKRTQGSEKKMMSSIKIIKNEWFNVANQKNADPHVIEGYLDAFEEISRPLLQRIVNFSDENGNTALHYAISYSNFDVVSILVDSKVCDLNKQNKAGYTCIMLVALADTKNDTHNYVVQRLFGMGDINIKATQNGQTALMLAVSHGKLEIVKMLLEAGAEVNLQDNDGSTALMCAAEHGHIEIVRILLSHPDCDPSILDADGCNALTIAMEAGHKDIGLLIYANMNFSRGSSPYSSLRQRRRTNSRSTPPPRIPVVRTPPSPSARSTCSLPSTFHFPN